MGTVTVGNEQYTVAGTLAACNTYLNGSRQFRAKWNASGAEDRAASMVDAYRMMEDLPWKSGITWTNETKAVEASYMLAGYFLMKPGGLGGPAGGSPTDGAVREVQDTTRRISFFYSKAAIEARTSLVDALPRDIYAKIRTLLARGQASAASAPYASGADGESEFTEEKKFSLVE